MPTSRYKWIIAVLAFAVAVEGFVIVFLLREHEDAAPPSGTKPSFAMVDAPRPVERKLVSVASVAAVESETIAPSSETRNIAVALAELTKRRGVKASVRFLNADGSTSDSFAELFGLSGDERRALDEAVNLCRRDITALLVGHARVTQQPSGAVEIQVDPFETDGGQLHDVLSERIGRVLGSERMIAFARLTGSQLDEAFDHFGAAARTLTISPATRSDGSTRYNVVDQLDHGGESSMSSMEYDDIHQLVRANPNFSEIVRSRFPAR